MTTAHDIVYFTPALEAGAYANVACAIPTGTSGTLSNVTSGGAATRTALELAQAPGTPTAGSFLINTTHPSAAWAVAVSAGSIWKWSQPTARTVTPSTFATPPSEVTSWINGDSAKLVTAAQITALSVGAILPINTNTGIDLTDGVVYVNNCNIFAATSGSVVVLNDNVTLQESTITSNFQTVQTGVGQFIGVSSWANNYLGGAYGALRGAPNGMLLTSGVVASSQFHGLNLIIDNDIVFSNAGSGTTSIIGTSPDNPQVDSSIGTAFIDTGKTVQITSNFTTIGTLLGANVIWGPGTFAASGLARIRYPSGAGAAAADFTVSNLRLNSNATVGCLNIPGAANTTQNCNIAFTAANLDINLGTTSGCFFSGLSAFCNYGN